MPQVDISGLPPGARVVPVEPAGQDPIELPVFGNDAPPVPTQTRQLPVGETLLGRVVDGAGAPLDGLGPLHGTFPAALSAKIINPLARAPIDTVLDVGIRALRSEEHTSELQSLMRISYAVFCL